MAYMQTNYGYPQFGYQNQFGQNQFVQPATQPIQQQNYQPINVQSNTLFGKYVDNFNTANAQDVPIGMSGIYPTADGSAVYIKQWCADGTTTTKEYKLVEQTSEKDEIVPTVDWSEKFNNISDRIEALSRKIDDIKIPTVPKKKRIVEEVDEDDE